MITIYLPPLRERREDIPELVGHFLRIYNEQNNRHVPHVERAAMEALQNYSWPGNVRELQNYIERAVVLAPGDETHAATCCPSACCGRKRRRIGRHARRHGDAGRRAGRAGRVRRRARKADNLHAKIVNRVERELIAQVMAACDNVQIKAADPAGHQPQHAAQEARGVRAGEVAFTVAGACRE